MKAQPPPNDVPLAGTNRKKMLVPSLILFAAIFGSLATARAAIYNFQLQGPNTAMDSGGNLIAMTGSGTFDTTKQTIAAGGSFTVYDLEGAVVSKGTWSAIVFHKFTSYGGVNKGFQTGKLQMYVALSAKHGSSIPGVLAMTVFCEPGETPGPAEADSEDGITVGQFTESTGGFTLFQLVRP
jgi:hypothetical protein